MKYDAISVTDLNKYIKDKIANDEALNNVLVKGERTYVFYFKR